MTERRNLFYSQRDYIYARFMKFIEEHPKADKSLLNKNKCNWGREEMLKARKIMDRK